MNRSFCAGSFLFFAAATIAWAQPSGYVETSDWNVYRNAKLGFEFKYPKFFQERRATGTVNGAPMERADFVGTQAAGKPQDLTFFVQRKINPEGLSVAQWYKDQMKDIPKAPPPKTAMIGGRPAAWYKVAGAFGKNYSFFVPLNKTDILTIAFTRPLSEEKLDETFETILSSVKFLD